MHAATRSIKMGILVFRNLILFRLKLFMLLDQPCRMSYSITDQITTLLCNAPLPPNIKQLFLYNSSPFLSKRIEQKKGDNREQKKIEIRESLWGLTGYSLLLLYYPHHQKWLDNFHLVSNISHSSSFPNFIFSTGFLLRIDAGFPQVPLQ